MRIIADRSRCEGHAMCEAIAPNLFRVGDDALASPLVDMIAESDRELAELAIDSCPVAALRLA
ncbi:ferredoxin [Nocardia altamirensis]|uniref:ferredoxin n=1 Tax=Nocardia altamirensis TaxID=472158 RepID=UPI000A03D4BC|nr:ferredoxin [Nocardia altamirensis]